MRLDIPVFTLSLQVPALDNRRDKTSQASSPGSLEHSVPPEEDQTLHVSPPSAKHPGPSGRLGCPYPQMTSQVTANALNLTATANHCFSNKDILLHIKKDLIF